MTHNTREELIKELRMVANMINMCERIQWGRETTLMDKAADMLETLHQELQKARAEIWNKVYLYADRELDGEVWLHSSQIIRRAKEDGVIINHSELDQPK